MFAIKIVSSPFRFSLNGNYLAMKKGLRILSSDYITPSRCAADAQYWESSLYNVSQTFTKILGSCFLPSFLYQTNLLSSVSLFLCLAVWLLRS